MTIIYSFSDKHIRRVYQLYKDVGWGHARSLEGTISSIKGSQVCIGLLDNNDNLIAFARVLSDYIYKAMIFDVIVSTEHRGRGLAQQLIKLIKSHKQLKQVKHFELYCLPEMEPFYSKLGFSAEVGGIKLMRSCND